MMWVVVPAYNEARGIRTTLRALAAQSDLDFTLLVVDNNSFDGTAEAVRAFADTAPMPVQIVVEPCKGVGCAVDTGFRHAIANGATMLARTDADCLPRSGWVAAVRAGLAGGAGRTDGAGGTGGAGGAGGAGMLCGRVVARRDEHGLVGRAWFRVVVALAALFGRLRPAHHGPEFRTPYRMHAGNNMAITPALYLACGGMPRRPSPTDRDFLNRVRRTTDAIERRSDMVVENSTRRLRAYGLLGAARWYLDHGCGRLTPDPR